MSNDFIVKCLLQECKKYLIGCRTVVLSEDTVRNACSEYFSTFYGNKLWPLFCLKPNDNKSNPDNDIWMRKHNNVNLVGWIKHPKFNVPSFCKRRKNYIYIFFFFQIYIYIYIMN